jgi:hypothetical protein
MVRRYTSTSTTHAAATAGNGGGDDDDELNKSFLLVGRAFTSTENE